jgi:hypothetical protein
MPLLIERPADIGRKGLKDVQTGFRLRSGTFEFIYEQGERAGRLLDVLSDSSRGYSLVPEGSSSIEIEGKMYDVEKFAVMRTTRSGELRVGDLEAQFHTGSLVAVFMDASDTELPPIAELVLSDKAKP